MSAKELKQINVAIAIIRARIASVESDKEVQADCDAAIKNLGLDFQMYFGTLINKTKDKTRIAAYKQTLHFGQSNAYFCVIPFWVGTPIGARLVYYKNNYESLMQSRANADYYVRQRKLIEIKTKLEALKLQALLDQVTSPLVESLLAEASQV